MSLEENKTIVRKFIEALNTQNLALLDEVLAPKYVDKTLHVRGLERLKPSVTRLHDAFPDFLETIEDIIAEGDKVWIRLSVTGTHTGEYRGVAPTGKTVTSEMVDIYRLASGKIVERIVVYDFIDFYKQLGVIDYTEQGKKLFPED